jgi:rSAM/selenodomain-associated transferase 1
MKKALIIFVKNLRPGNVKTRIAAVVGDLAAMTIYQRLLEQTMLISRGVAADKFVYYADTIEESDLFVTEHFQKRIQARGDLGSKMKTAFAEIFSAGYEKVCIIGSDCIALTSTIIANAFDSLDQHEVVLGPAVDGGYYLIGMKDSVKPLFHDIEWSTVAVFDQTMEHIVEEELSYYLLPVLPDVDTVNDLPEHWKQEFTSLL